MTRPTFQKLVDGTSLEITQHMLKNSAMEVRQIALALGYADPSAFTRAFRRWSGTTPARWRLECDAADRKQLGPGRPNAGRYKLNS